MVMLQELPTEEVSSSNGHHVNEENEREYWKDIAGSVRVRNIPLVNVEQLEGGYVHTSVVTTKKLKDGSTVTNGGNETVIDLDYAYYQVGILLTQLGFSVKDIGGKKLTGFINETLKYYPDEYTKEKSVKEVEKLQGSKQKVYAQSIQMFRKLDLTNGRLDRASWSDDQWLQWMEANGFIQ